MMMDCLIPLEDVIRESCSLLATLATCSTIMGLEGIFATKMEALVVNLITGYLPLAKGKITVTPTCAEQLFPAMPGIE